MSLPWGRAGRRRRRVTLGHRIGGVILLALAALAAVISFALAEFDLRVRGESPTAVAEVVAVDPGLLDITVAYVTNQGIQATAEVTDFVGEPHVGDRLTVQYSNADPTYYVKDAAYGSNVGGAVFCAAMAIGLGVLGLFTWLGRFAGFSGLDLFAWW